MARLALVAHWHSVPARRAIGGVSAWMGRWRLRAMPRTMAAMRVRRGEQFQHEVERYGLRFCCEDCAFFNPALDVCAHGWPTDQHRREFYQSGEGNDWVLYCKEFELG